MVSTPIELLNEESDHNNSKRTSKLFCNLGVQKQRETRELDLKYLNSLVCDDEISPLYADDETNSKVSQNQKLKSSSGENNTSIS